MQDTELKTRLSTKTLLGGIQATSSASKKAQYAAIYIIYNTDDITNSGIGLAGGNEQNIVFINIKGRVDRSKAMAVVAVPPGKLSRMVRCMDQIACDIEIIHGSDSIKISDNTTSYSISKLNLDTNWIVKVLDSEFCGFSKEDGEAFVPIEFTMDNDAFKDLSTISSSALGEIVNEDLDKIFLIANLEKLMFMKVNKSVVAQLTKKSEIKLPEDTKAIMIQLPTSTVKDVLRPFIDSIIAENKITVHKSFIIVEKDDGSGMCAFARGLNVKSPVANVKLLSENSDKVAELNMEYPKMKGLLNTITAVVEDIGISTTMNCILNGDGSGSIDVRHVTSVASVDTSSELEYNVWNSEGMKVTNNAGKGTAVIEAISPKRMADSLDFIRSITESYKSEDRDKITISVHQGPTMKKSNGDKDRMDYIKIGTEEYYVMLSCSCIISAERLVLPISMEL